MTLKWALLSVFFMLNVFDSLTTTIAVKSYGLSVEANPLMRWVIETYSLTGMWAIKALIILYLAAAIKHIRKRVFVLLNVVFSLIVTTNLIGLIP